MIIRRQWNPFAQVCCQPVAPEHGPYTDRPPPAACLALGMVGRQTTSPEFFFPEDTEASAAVNRSSSETGWISGSPWLKQVHPDCHNQLFCSFHFGRCTVSVFPGSYKQVQRAEVHSHHFHVEAILPVSSLLESPSLTSCLNHPWDGRRLNVQTRTDPRCWSMTVIFVLKLSLPNCWPDCCLDVLT